ncbi:hypothetical protein [Dickeya undicola]|uniref:PIN domain-containing protein n=1 Tax=Dickeya undicola TaxID=1577887 RepID=A0A3N0FIZ8_9GAMM|nr:hypothetical protein [Dickeya undicola]RNL99859.1 hypothetical protein EF878_21130 [Dickeya undicola]
MKDFYESLIDNKVQAIIIIDTNAWNFLKNSQIDLYSAELSAYDFYITIEIYREMESLAEREDKADIYAYFKGQTADFGYPLSHFGAYDSRYPDDEQRFSGFGFGRLSSIFDDNLIERNAASVKSSKRGVYYGNEADLFISSWGNGKCFILTEDNRGCT